VRTLQDIGSKEVLDRATASCCSHNPLERARGADILAQLGKTIGHPSNIYPQESFVAVSTLVRTETESLPLRAAIHALGHIANPLAVSLVAKHHTHTDPEVRFAVACALGNFPDNQHAAAALVSLTRDEDDDVRDWATFGIGALGKLDTPEIRDALESRLADSSEDVQQEAIAGLARMRDQRVLSALLSALSQPTVAEITIDAACEMLGTQDAIVGWEAQDYATALRERFGQ